jgi:hypothetical protein
LIHPFGGYEIGCKKSWLEYHIRNPCFSLYATEDQQSISVFYGLELMEVVPDDPDQMAFKMLAGGLYNAGVLVAKLEEVFKADRKTIRAWGEAIVSRDPEHLARVLRGRGVNQKRTPAIDKFVVRRWDELLAEGCPNYRATLIREIESIFEVKLSGETLRQIILEIKGSRAVLSGNSPTLTAVPPWHPEEEITCSENSITTTDDLAIIALEATPATIDAVLRWNYQQLAIPEGDHDLYYDPHTIHYTGTQNILKGWCAAIRWADKLINSDYRPHRPRPPHLLRMHRQLRRPARPLLPPHQPPPPPNTKNSPASTMRPNAMKNTAPSESLKSKTSINTSSKTKNKNPR